MAERDIKKGKLELSLVSVIRQDILEKKDKLSLSSGGEKVGELDTYRYGREGIKGNVIYKEVYDFDGNMKSSYFGPFGRCEEEIIKITSSLSVLIENISFSNTRILK